MTVTSSNFDRKSDIRNKKLEKDESFYEDVEEDNKKPWKKGRKHGFERVSKTSDADDE